MIFAVGIVIKEFKFISQLVGKDAYKLIEIVTLEVDINIIIPGDKILMTDCAQERTAA